MQGVLVFVGMPAPENRIFILWKEDWKILIQGKWLHNILSLYFGENWNKIWSIGHHGNHGDTLMASVTMAAVKILWVL